LLFARSAGDDLPHFDESSLEALGIGSPWNRSPLCLRTIEKEVNERVLLTHHDTACQLTDLFQLPSTQSENCYNGVRLLTLLEKRVPDAGKQVMCGRQGIGEPMIKNVR
jgi:hypothetical protein